MEKGREGGREEGREGGRVCVGERRRGETVAVGVDGRGWLALDMRIERGAPAEHWSVSFRY